ncbi:BglG family transcription antiterminator [Aneurinibacillus sp. Ricciae_BoGa-3]|uniref:BglG family transcription antiterminator n=1 Tax=Aneurinibacillus sp. Ricciae_BoGa-3 TaxID=3022697 RepID=UPI0023424825|nr:BglG family transcription antiterminator [Aneurinibacillus sp. Ricciae_BoGa-3]WCK54811.1 BglG family transcription antiterminator [Aneurinibacillus sp. Ricciae_BoGa-3]
MFITSREKAIIELIIKTSGKHTALSIATFLNVSVRTIHRDLKTVKKTLQQFDLRLTRNTDEGLVIEGKNEQIFRLIQYLMGSQPINQTSQERKLLLLLALLEEEQYKIQALAIHLGVSITTLTTYLDELSEWLNNFNVELTRKRGVGVKLDAAEANKRKALASYFLLYFNEELIESLFLLEKGKCSDARILHYFLPDYLLAIDRLVNNTINSGQSRLADSDYIGLIVHLCITMQRTKAQFLLEEDPGNTNELRDEHGLIMKICKELESTFSITFTGHDISYLSVILKGSKLQAADAVPYDSVVLGQMIKNLIQHVSSQLHIDLTKDFSLFQGLLAHMEPSLFRIKQKMGLFNPLTEDIKRKYPILFMAVRNSVEKEFKEIDYFPDDEIAFIVLHFGSALVMREEELAMKALVVCPTGIGTSKMLASRIKKEFLEIESVEIKSIKEIQQQGNLNRYDIIISTVRLPLIAIDYILVTPLLSEEDIATIRRFLKKNIENLTKNKHYKKSVHKQVPPSDRGISEVLQELKDVQQSIQAILDNFRVYRMPPAKQHELVIEDMVRMAEQEKLLSDADDVIEALKDRERKGGLGIPHTGMGLFHCRHNKVHELIFQVSHLDKPCLIKGMDGKLMYMRSLLLMLAPEELSAREQEIVSLISTSLIETNEAKMIYSSSNEGMIRTRLEEIFLDYLHTNLIKD